MSCNLLPGVATDDCNGARTIALTLGDVGGIGPELLLKVLADPDTRSFCRPVVIGDADLLAEHARALGSTLRIATVDRVTATAPEPDVVEVVAAGGPRPDRIRWGEVDPDAGRFAAACLQTAMELARDGQVDGLVWPPINKQAFHRAGYPFTDEVEFLADLTGCVDTRLFGVLGDLWVLALTLHVPLAAVPGLVSRAEVLDAIVLLAATLQDAGRDRPAIAVAGLNPHAGDGGRIGREELDEIEPAIRDAQGRGLDVHGPFPADTMFPRAFADGVDGLLCMYHDQANIARKLQGPSGGASVVVGLPVPCATTAHGTAFDRVRQGTSDPGSLEAALRCVASLADSAARRRAASV